MRQIIEDLISMMEYHVEQTRPIHTTTVALQAAREALAKQEQGEPDELNHINEQDCLLDVDEKAWRSLIENRGGCRCHLSPPCGACTNPISEEEMNEVGYTYTTPQQRTWIGLTDDELENVWPFVFKPHELRNKAIYQAIEAKLKEKNNEICSKN